MTPSSAFPADTGHTAPGASNRGSARHQRGRRSTRKPDLTAHVEPEHAAGTAPSVAVRKTADGAHRPSWGTDPVRYTSVDTATQRPPARQGDTSRDREKTARIAENSQPAGRFRSVWQVLGSNQRRLSRRFYSPSLLPEVHAADQHIRRSRRHPAPPPSAMRPCAPGLVHGRGRKKPRTGVMGAVTLTVRPGYVPLTWHFRMPARCGHLPRHRTRAGCLVF
jgi:hypothetical protein